MSSSAYCVEACHDRGEVLEISLRTSRSTSVDLHRWVRAVGHRAAVVTGRHDEGPRSLGQREAIGSGADVHAIPAADQDGVEAGLGRGEHIDLSNGRVPAGAQLGAIGGAQADPRRERAGVGELREAERDGVARSC